MTRDLARIAGVIYPDPLQVDECIESMLDTMEKGLKPIRERKTIKNFQFGIVGASFVYNEKKGLLLGLDGFIENSHELAQDLKKHGLSPSLDQAELVLQAYELYTSDFLQKIDGSFALFIFDEEKRELLLARDRIGKKPLYWYHDQKHFIFGSELKSLIATGIVPQTFSPDAIAMYLYFGYIPQDLSPIKDVNKLLPANYLSYSPKKGISIHSYWSYSHFFERKEDSSAKHVKETIERYLSDSIKRLVPQSGKVCSFLSGGIGSATIAYELSRVAQKPDAYTVFFQGKTEADLDATKIVANTLDLPHHISAITPSNFTENLVETIWALDEPLADPNFVATAKLCGMARNSDAAFSGMGSDEFLAGHSRYTSSEQTLTYMSRLNLIPQPIIRNFLIPLFYKIYKPAAYNILKISRTNPWQFEFLRHNALFNETQLYEASPKLARLFDPDTFLHKFHNLTRIKSTVSTLQYFDVKTRLPDAFMLQFERLTKINGIIWQTPFLDKHLVEFAAALPEPEMITESEAASYLKPLIKDIFPNSFVERPKRTRRNILDEWALSAEVQALFKFLRDGTLVENGIISKKWIENTLKSPQSMTENFYALWGLAVLEIWFHLYINRPVHAEPSTFNLNELLSAT